MAIKLFTRPASSGSKVQWALEELGLPYESVDLDWNGTHSAEYMVINPNAKVPALIDGDETYFESLACIIHLAERYGVERGLWPKDGPARAQALSYTVWGIAELQGFMMQYIYHGLDSAVSYKPEQRSQATADYNGGETRRMLDLLDKRLAGREHILGEFSLADVAVAGPLSVGRMLGLDLAGWPGVRAYVERCASRPAFKRAR